MLAGVGCKCLGTLRAKRTFSHLLLMKKLKEEKDVKTCCSRRTASSRATLMCWMRPFPRRIVFGFRARRKAAAKDSSPKSIGSTRSDCLARRSSPTLAMLSKPRTMSALKRFQPHIQDRATMAFISSSAKGCLCCAGLISSHCVTKA